MEALWIRFEACLETGGIFEGLFEVLSDTTPVDVREDALGGEILSHSDRI